MSIHTQYIYNSLLVDALIVYKEASSYQDRSLGDTVGHMHFEETHRIATSNKSSGMYQSKTEHNDPRLSPGQNKKYAVGPVHTLPNNIIGFSKINYQREAMVYYLVFAKIRVFEALENMCLPSSGPNSI